MASFPGLSASVHAFFFAAAFLFPPSATAQIAWRSDFDHAKEEAAKTKTPLFIVFLMDDEPANDQIVKDHLHDPAIVDVSKNFICLIACAGAHGAGEADRPCPRFAGVKCAEHRRVEVKARMQFMNSPRVAAPQFLVVAPDGKTVLLRHVYLLSAKELKKKLDLALGLGNPDGPNEEIAAMKKTNDRLMHDALDQNAARRKEAVDALATSDDPRVMDFFITRTAETVDDVQRIEVIEAMGRAKSARSLAVLEKLLHAKSNLVRIAAAGTLETIAMPDAAPALLAALKRETKTIVRGRLVRALAISDPLSAEPQKAMLGMMKSASPVDRMNALRVAPRLPESPELTAILMSAAKDSNANVRGVGYWAIGERKAAACKEAILKSVQGEKSALVKDLARYAISRLGGEAWSGPDPVKCLDDLFETAGLAD